MQTSAANRGPALAAVAIAPQRARRCGSGRGNMSVVGRGSGRTDRWVRPHRPSVCPRFQLCLIANHHTRSHVLPIGTPIAKFAPPPAGAIRPARSAALHIFSTFAVFDEFQPADTGAGAGLIGGKDREAPLLPGTGASRGAIQSQVRAESRPFSTIRR